ncbi:hypothetical protein KC853_01065 [Candidatus Saccharibacteria bacterium]|nr:hypothetical protein [Candidatus Saccharibacteria bacterium]MCB9834434.1 hypothetical protein [Candidatus Nomurabacteria bacterium]
MEKNTPHESEVSLETVQGQFNKDLWEQPEWRQILANISGRKLSSLGQDTPLFQLSQ